MKKVQFNYRFKEKTAGVGFEPTLCTLTGCEPTFHLYTIIIPYTRGKRCYSPSLSSSSLSSTSAPAIQILPTVSTASS